jgi:hypothetical protein
MSEKVIGISVRDIPLISEFGETLFPNRTVFSAPFRLLEVLWLLEFIKPLPEGINDIPLLQQYYLDNKDDDSWRQFNIPCFELTTREGDFHDSLRCGELEVPNPVCPRCEYKLRCFRLIDLEEDEELKHDFEVTCELIYERTRASNSEYSVSTVVAALRDLKTVRRFPNATIIAWDDLGEESIIEERNEVPRYWF